MVRLAPLQEVEAVFQVETLQTKSNRTALQATGPVTDLDRRIVGRISL